MFFITFYHFVRKNTIDYFEIVYILRFIREFVCFELLGSKMVITVDFIFLQLFVFFRFS